MKQTDSSESERPNRTEAERDRDIDREPVYAGGESSESVRSCTDHSVLLWDTDIQDLLSLSYL